MKLRPYQQDAVASTVSALQQASSATCQGNGPTHTHPGTSLERRCYPRATRSDPLVIHYPKIRETP